MVSYKRTMAQRHGRILTMDPSSELLEERGASVVSGEEAGLLSRFVSHFNLSNIVKKIASSKAMMFFIPHIYLRNASDKEAAAYKLFQKRTLTRSRRISSRAMSITNGELMVSVLTKHGQDILINSIPSANLNGYELNISIGVEDALINFLANAKSVQNTKNFADRLDDALFKLSNNLQKADAISKEIGERIEGKLLFEPISSKNNNLVDDNTIQPVLSSQQNGRRMPHIYLRDVSEKQGAALILLKNAHVDKVKRDLFSSQEFQTWSKYFADAFPDNPKVGASLMVDALWKVDKLTLIYSIKTAEVVNGKLAFSDDFKGALLEKLAWYRKTKGFESETKLLEDSLFYLSHKLKRGDDNSRSIGELLEGELYVESISSDMEIADRFEFPSVQKWYFSLPKQEGKSAASVLLFKLEEQGLNYNDIGYAVANAKTKTTMAIMKELVDYIMQVQMDTSHLKKAIIGQSSNFSWWVMDAAKLKADVGTSVLPTLRKNLTDEQILLHCSAAENLGDDAIALVKNTGCHQAGKDKTLLTDFRCADFSSRDVPESDWTGYMRLKHLRKQTSC
ncbi:hypothetical protein Plhal304r1_c007g0028691 [Plasmopara halstedii]